MVSNYLIKKINLSNIAQLFLLTKVKQMEKYFVIVYCFFFGEKYRFDYLHTQEIQ